MSSTTPLDVFVENLLAAMFFETDDEKAIQAFEAGLSEDIRIEVNGAILPRPVYLGIVKGIRKDNVATDLGNPTLAMHVEDAEKQTGTVAQCGKFTLKNKSTGEEKTSSAGTIAKVEFRDGKRVMTSLTEVMS
ncbi:hypothetical protein DACRYDRAFT_109280 [Dacryopinax primogenitus]|uniref:Uncharacterized protein n=1 Tax=Dacryopinax primogenitus (strain DJM 731) TaxID=1858805 RepID=M5FW26_DACPD|nr:uncharacterized protein DACRYDRAFT_109280 [Dacryopinax primogenitus]EJT99854.1 hypothetical protein DACRYDRAFT_109280 [Dacryopinax primogenitus]